jgi:hypothetical protein
MPVASQGDDHDERGDDQKARGFQGIDMRARGIRPVLWGGSRHEDYCNAGVGSQDSPVEQVRREK